MAGKYLLDTNIIIALFKQDANVLHQLGQSSEIYVPVIAIGELFYGASHSAQVQRNMQEVKAFAAQAQLLPCDLLTAEIYGQVKNNLKAKGNPIPENDVWIAAIAPQHELTVVTRDLHFQKIDGLPFEIW